MSLVCCAHLDQQGTRDLALLEEVCDRVRWLDTADLITASEPCVVCGLAASEQVEQLSELLQERSRAGRATVLVPRFRSGDLGPALKAPSAVVIKSGESSEIVWAEGGTFEVSAVTVVSTSLSTHRWAGSDSGCCVLCYRPNTASGAIIICTATVAGPALGVELTEQRRLLELILSSVSSREESSGSVPAADTSSEGGERTFDDLDSFLREAGADGAAVLLALVASGGDRTGDLSEVAREQIAMELLPDRALDLLGSLPPADVNEMRAVLRRTGWGAHLRRVLLLQSEGGLP